MSRALVWLHRFGVALLALVAEYAHVLPPRALAWLALATTAVVRAFLASPDCISEVPSDGARVDALLHDVVASPVAPSLREAEQAAQLGALRAKTVRVLDAAVTP